jgi:alginate O-acetyltransferase complex protein AlgI
VLLLGICWFLPNAYQLLGRSSPALQEVGPAPALQWNPDLAWALALAVLAALSLSQILSGAPSAFIYFQF